uniref:Major facilitator superfamily (MFS) profile domain-containing protein n=1 Tax=Strigamia maritima TaxID=126957 RepID=T1J667_STRMM
MQFAKAFLRSAFGIGLTIGPTIGGLLYQMGGFTLPFACIGGLLLAIAIINISLFWSENGKQLFKLLKNNRESSVIAEESVRSVESSTIGRVLSIPSVTLCLLAASVGAISIGFFETTLEPHLRQFKVEPVVVGLAFLTTAGSEAISFPLLAWFCNGKQYLKLVIAFGHFLICITYLFVGPAPFIPIASEFWMSIVGLVFHGLGLGTVFFATHVEALQALILYGYSDSFQTYGMISGVWFAFFEFGHFVGPSMSGVIYDLLGFRLATQIILIFQLIMVIANILYYFVFDMRRLKSDESSIKLIASDCCLSEGNNNVNMSSERVSQSTINRLKCIFLSLSWHRIKLNANMCGQIGEIGPLFLLNAGTFLTSSCCMLFGVLDQIKSVSAFITFTFLVRILEATGKSAVMTSSYSLVAQTFPRDVGKVFACLRASFGIGLTVGPTIGGLLYQAGGFCLPFVSMGGLLFATTVINTLMLFPTNEQYINSVKSKNMLHALSIPSVTLSLTSAGISALSIGFFETTLEPHLRQKYLKPIIAWGHLLLCTAYLVIGPAPFIPFTGKLWITIVAMAFNGLGLGAILLATHVEALQAAILNGFPDSFQTYGMISGVWAAFFEFGHFVGPSIGGIIYDQLGFRLASQIPFAFQLIMVIAIVYYYFVYDMRRIKLEDSSS